nr:type II toxin-antitoxin system HicA family toxin [Anaerovibrio sp. RM50]
MKAGFLKKAPSRSWESFESLPLLHNKKAYQSASNHTLVGRKSFPYTKHNGFIPIKSNNGSHKKLFNPVTNVTVTVPMHSKDLKKGLEQAI